MPFERYPSIVNHTDFDFLQRVQRLEQEQPSTWCLLEKCHGSNVQIVVFSDASQETEYGSRSQSLGSADFKGLRGVVAGFHEALREVVKESGLEFLRFFGELYSGTKKIVAGAIPYCKDLRVVLFDAQRPDGSFCHYGELCAQFRERSIPHCPILYQGSYVDVMEEAARTCADPTTFWDGQLGSSAAPREGNIVKPLQGRVLPSGSRVIFKVKNPVHAESKVRLDASQLPGVLRGAAVVESLLTEARASSVLSKHADPRERGVEALAEDLFDDVIEELSRAPADCGLQYIKAEGRKAVLGLATHLVKKALSELEEPAP